MNNRAIFLIFKNQIARELRLKFRNYKSVYNAFLFFLMLIIFFNLTMQINLQNLHILTPGIIWIGLIFNVFLSSESLFAQDYADGIIDQWLVSPMPISLLVIAKLSVHCCIIIGSLVLLSPILGILLQLNFYQVMILDLSIMFGVPSIVSLCALAEAFAVSIKQKSLVMGLIVLPLNIPILIIGSAIIRAVIMHEPFAAMLAILLAISCTLGFLLPFAIAATLKICLS